MAMKKLAGFNGQNSFYDLQASMYTLKKITMMNECSKLRAFRLHDRSRCDHLPNDLRRNATSAPALTNKSILEALSLFISGPDFANQKDMERWKDFNWKNT
ncbi:hypothetical protein B9Z55_026038 [Caenorhabditis nigoni]|uniref:Uncharacterized protein n=2 Tax=Caenorhabditis nigoni TaxID=1611254 RepID=A0A2G5T1I2_9PELO|nr:hypothetical protein B9Z55_026038 [Caenorhabditis nigoni]